MDHQLRIQQNPIHYALLLLLAVQWGRVLAMPVHKQSGVCLSAIGLTETLQHEASELLDSYVRFHQFQADSIPEDVPKAEVSGSTPAERLYNIAVQEMLFHLHLSVVEEDNKDFWGNTDSGLQQAYSTAMLRLAYHYKKIGELLREVDPNFISLTTPAPLDLHIDGSFAKKHYGWGVLSNLTVLANNVRQELKSVCGEEL